MCWHLFSAFGAHKHSAVRSEWRIQINLRWMGSSDLVFREFYFQVNDEYIEVSSPIRMFWTDFASSRRVLSEFSDTNNTSNVYPKSIVLKLAIFHETPPCFRQHRCFSERQPILNDSHDNHWRTHHRNGILLTNCLIFWWCFITKSCTKRI